MPTIPDPHTVLTAVADHIATNPAVADTVISVSPGRAMIQIYPVGRPGPRQNLMMLAEWIRSLYDVAPAVVDVAPTATKAAHLDLYCQLHNGTTITLSIVLDLDESVALAANVPEELRAGDAVPAELLLRLAEYADLELPEQEPVSPATLVDLLSLASAMVTPEQVETWTPEQRRQAEQWASATHLSASDNDVAVPEQPDFLAVGDFQVGDVVRDRKTGEVLTVTGGGVWLDSLYEPAGETAP